MEECPGYGKCHGCVHWCDWCGDVAFTCDYSECDQHRRPEEIRDELAEVLGEMRALARATWKKERTGPELTREGELAFRNRMRSAAREIRSLEESEARLEEDLKRAVHEQVNGRLAERPMPPATDEETGQLSLFSAPA